MAIGVALGIASIGSSIFGSRSAKKAAKAQMEMMKRQAEAAFLNQSRSLKAQFEMGREDAIFGAAQQLLQEKLNNKVAMENYRYAQMIDDMKLKEANAAIAKQNQKRAAMEALRREGMVHQHAFQGVNAAIEKSSAEREIRKQSSMAAAKQASMANARGTGSVTVMNNPLMAMTARDASEKMAEIDAKNFNNRQAATKQLHMQLAMSHLNAQGEAMKRKIEGRPPTLFDSTRTVQYLLQRNVSNMGKQYNMGMLNAQEARRAGMANAQAQYQSAKSAANSKMWSSIGGTLLGMGLAQMKFGNTPSSTNAADGFNTNIGNPRLDLNMNPAVNPLYTPQYTAFV